VALPSTQKAALRRAVLATRDALSADVRAALDRRITQRLLALAPLARARARLAYLSFGSEFDTQGVLAHLLERRARVALPRVNRQSRRLELFFVNDLGSDTAPGVWGIREPDPARCVAADLHAIELVLAPGVAFTARGERLGYGGGFYDKLLGGWHPRPTVIAAAYDAQLVDALPTNDDDVPVDVVVTETALFTRSA
jgi:5,10-methenyltetrahydrofolate synthetase